MKLNSMALSEVYEILISLSPTEYKKIPKNIIINIRDNREKNYDPDFNELQAGKMSKEASKILAAIYLKYLALDDEKNVVKKIILNQKSQKNTITIRDNIFEEKPKKVNSNENQIIVVKKSRFKKFLDKIKSFFMKGV